MKILATFFAACLFGARIAAQTPLPPPSSSPGSFNNVFARENLLAWCIVPFDAKKRGPEERAQMLERLGIRRLAYDWRSEHIPTFDAEVDAMQRHGIEITAWWFPETLDANARVIFDVIERRGIRPQLWIMGSSNPEDGEAARAAHLEREAARLRPIAVEAQRLGCKVALYNHGGWFGEPENQIALIERLAQDGLRNLGIVYNFHHGHDHISRFPALWEKMRPHLLAVNLNGMVRDGDKSKILTLGEGKEELAMMRVIAKSGWRGLVGIINHRPELDAEVALRANLHGLERLRQELNQSLSESDRSLPGSASSSQPATEFIAQKAPLDPAAHPLHTHPVNRDRIYDFYAKQVRYAMAQQPRPNMLAAFPGLDGGKFGHWGNQNEKTWQDARWNEMDLGSMQSGVFRGWDQTVARAVCVRLGERGEIAACFDPDTLTWVAAWSGGFIQFSPVRHGFLGGCEPVGTRLEIPVEKPAPRGSFTYHGFYRHGSRVVFHYTLDGADWLDSAWSEGGRFVRHRVRVGEPPLAALTEPGSAKWPQIFETQGSLGNGLPYAVDTIEPPVVTPWRSLWHFGDLDFFANGDAAICTIEGEVWLARGIDASLARVRWKRFAAGLHQPLGLKIVDEKIHVLGRDQITILHDSNGDDEADRYECFSNAYQSSPAGHDFITGLQRDTDGRFYFASSKQGICRVSHDGRTVEVLSTGFRNPDGLGLGPRGEVIAAVQEGEWTPASMLAEITPGGHYGYGGPRPGALGHLPPLVYLPRGLDNSCGGQVFVEGTKWGVPPGFLVHLSYGAGAAFLVIRDSTNPAQGGVVPLPGDFNSGAHRGRFHPRDGQLYVCGTAGWGTYTPADGCFQRLRHTGNSVRAPLAFEARANGVILSFADPVDAGVASSVGGWFAQAWKYRYGPAYGSDEFSLQHDHPGHDVLEITSAHLSASGCSLFLEIPQLQPAHTVHFYNADLPLVSRDIFLTIHKLGEPFTQFAGYHPVAKKSLPVTELDTSAAARPMPVKWEQGAPGHAIRIQTTTGLQFVQRELRVHAGERISLTLENPDVMPHNWVLVVRDGVERITDLANRFVTDPTAIARHYVPNTPLVLVHTRIVEPASSTTIHFTAPAERGDYPYLCTFPGHASVMRGVLRVE